MRHHPRTRSQSAYATRQGRLPPEPPLSRHPAHHDRHLAKSMAHRGQHAAFGPILCGWGPGFRIEPDRFPASGYGHRSFPA